VSRAGVVVVIFCRKEFCRRVFFADLVIMHSALRQLISGTTFFSLTIVYALSISV